jgi:hypothetical protein
MAKRAFQAVVLFFAICGFLFVPLGKRTAIEHLQAIAGTPAAQQAGTELKRGIVRLFDRLRSRASDSAERDAVQFDDETSGAREIDAKPRQRPSPKRERKPPPTAASAPK